MKIAIFSDSFLPYCSGVTFAIINQARELCRRGHQISIFRPRPSKALRGTGGQLPDSVAVYDLPLSIPVPKLRGLRLVVPLLLTSLRRLRRIKPDVVHVNTEWGCGWEGLLAARHLGIPTVGTFHTFFADPEYLKAMGLPNWRPIRACMWTNSVSFFNRCQVVTSPSTAVKQALLEHGLRREPIVVSNGIQSPGLVPAEQIAQLRASHGIHGPSFVYVGRLSREKSLDVLLHAFRLVRGAYADARLIVIGDGPFRPRLQQRICDLALQSDVILMGHIAHESLIARNLPLLGDAFVTASKTENQPLSILEAMSFGLPVIGPRAKGLCELIQDEVNGLSFPPDDVQAMADRMIRLIQDDTLRRRLGRAAKRLAGAHGISGAVDQLEAIYAQVGSPQPVRSGSGVPDSSAAA